MTPGSPRPKFLVYTMECGEPDWHCCKLMIESQRDVTIEHHVVSNLPEVEAHNRVYEAFNEAGPSWIRAKIDADVVLSDENVFNRVAQLLVELPMADGIGPLVYDFLSDNQIQAGMVFYTSRILFNVQRNPLFCDRNVIVNPYTRYVHSHQHVMGDHMRHCNEFTAFHYGFHRGLKGQTNIYASVKAAHAVLGDDRRWWALQGFEAALSGGHGLDGHNYGDETLRALFDQTMKTTLGSSNLT